ncbi:TetR/AcrR family transcriptional regulator [Mycolicibacterium elephantis]
MPQSTRSEVRRRILDAARNLLLSNGIRGVTMTDVGRAAGCSRQLVYKVFFDRRELLLAAVTDRVLEIADEAAAGTTVPGEAFHPAFVELSVKIIEALRNDPELTALWGEGSPITAHEALWAPELTERALQFWRPWLDYGRSHRLLRNDLSNEELADWLHTVYASIILRRNIPQEQERILIERFVMTSLTMATTPPEA